MKSKNTTPDKEVRIRTAVQGLLIALAVAQWPEYRSMIESPLALDILAMVIGAVVGWIYDKFAFDSKQKMKDVNKR